MVDVEAVSKIASRRKPSAVIDEELETNGNLIICPVDESKDLIIFEKDVYLKKLSEVFEPSKFRKLNHNPVNVDFEAFRKVIAEFRPHLTCAEAYIMRPIEI